MGVDVVVVLVDRVGALLDASGREARRGNAETHGHVGVRRRGAVVREFDPEHGLRGARRLQYGTVVRTASRGAVADLLEGDVQHLCGVRNAPDGVLFGDRFLKGRANRPFRVEDRRVFVASDVDVDRARGGDRIDGRSPADCSDRKGRLRFLRHLEVRDARPRKAHGMDGARHLAEGAETVPARTRHRAAPTVRADGGVENPPDVRVVDRDEAVGCGGRREEVFGSANVAVSLFADGADEKDVGFGCKVVRFHRPKRLEHRAQPRTVVADPGAVVAVPFAAHGDVGAFREHRIHVCAHDEQGARPRAFPGEASDHVPDRVDRDVLEPEGFHESNNFRRAHLLVKGRGGNFAERFLKFHRLRCVRFEVPQGRIDGGVTFERLQALKDVGMKRRNLSHDGSPGFFRLFVRVRTVSENPTPDGAVGEKRENTRTRTNRNA